MREDADRTSDISLQVGKTEAPWYRRRQPPAGSEAGACHILRIEWMHSMVRAPRVVAGSPRNTTAAAGKWAMSDMARNRDLLNGILSAMVAVNEIVGPIKIKDMNDQTWNVVTKINARLAELAAAEAARLDDGQ